MATIPWGYGSMSIFMILIFMVYLALIGISIVGFILFVKLALRGIRALDIYIEKNSGPGGRS